MAERFFYCSQLSLEAAAFLALLSKRQQRRALDFADRIARNPFIACNYQLTDERGRSIDHLLLDEFLFSYRVDHAAREVLITEIAIV